MKRSVVEGIEQEKPGIHEGVQYTSSFNIKGVNIQKNDCIR